jgi:penicillin G amidase
MIGPLLAVFILALLTLAGIWFLAYGLDTSAQDELEVSTLRHPAQIGWFEDGRITIDADNELDAATALGYAHASTHLWPISLWRQTALGTLTAWFGPELLELDRFTRELRFDALAQETFRTLPADQQAYLRAYAAGINSAFDETAFLAQDEFALLQVTPARWRPWHTLSVERLMGWLAVRLDTTAAGDSPLPLPLRRFLSTDRQLRGWLQLHSFDYSFAWVQSDSTGAALGQRHVTGSTPIPLFLETIVRTPTGERIIAGIPGTPITPAGRAQGSTWAILLRSDARITPASANLSRNTPMIYERIEGRNGIEFLHAFRPGRSHVQFLAFKDTSEVIPDSALTLFWAGFEPGTDLAAWRALPAWPDSAFTLFAGAGIRMGRDGTWSLHGNPAFQTTSGPITLVGDTPWTPYLARHLDAITRLPAGVDRFAGWNEDCYSDWAADLAPRFLAALKESDSLSAMDRDALTYLRNWDFSYARASIGASIFDAWLDGLNGRRHTTHPDAFGTLPPHDTLLVAFKRAITHLADTLGTDLSTWRLENYHPITYRYPAWSFADTFNVDGLRLSETRFAPLQLPGRGHPSTLCWGSFETGDHFQSSATWDAWAYPPPNDTLYTRRRSLDASGFLGRYRIPVNPPGTHRLHPDAEPTSVTRLVPADR